MIAGGVVVLGLGNPVLSDDAVGLRIAAELQRRLADRPLPGVTVLASTRAGFELLDMLSGFACALIVDALEVASPRPGLVHRLTLSDVAGSARLNMSHEISLTTAFELAARLGIPMPAHVEIVAVEAADTHTLNEELTPAVAECVPRVAEMLYSRAGELAALHPAAADAPRPRVFYPPQ